MDASQFLLSDICMQSGWWFQTWILFSMSYMGCHPSHWRTPSFFKMVIAPPIRYWLIHLGMVYFIYTIINHYKPLLTTIKTTCFTQAEFQHGGTFHPKDPAGWKSLNRIKAHLTHEPMGSRGHCSTANKWHMVIIYIYNYIYITYIYIFNIIYIVYIYIDI